MVAPGAIATPPGCSLSRQATLLVILAISAGSAAENNDFREHKTRTLLIFRNSESVSGLVFWGKVRGVNLVSSALLDFQKVFG